MIDNIQALANEIQFNFVGASKLDSLVWVLRQYQGEDWKRSAAFGIDTYQRNILYQSKDFEIRLLCWGPSQQTNIHDHPEQGCILKVLEGELIEYRYDLKTDFTAKTCLSMKRTKLSQKLSQKLFRDTYSYIDNSQAYHRMCNESSKPAVSLHIYAPPNYIAREIHV